MAKEGGKQFSGNLRPLQYAGGGEDLILKFKGRQNRRIGNAPYETPSEKKLARGPI